MVRRIVSTALLVCLFLFLLFPLYWTAVTSFKTNLEIFRLPPDWLPARPTLDNYRRALGTDAFVRYFTNNVLVAAAATVVTTLTAVCAGYSLSRYPTRITRAISLGLLSTQMYPVIGIIIALYTVFHSLGLLNTRGGLTVALTAHSIPFCVWLIKGFLDDVPRSIEESARIDGAGRTAILFRIVVPLAKPGLLAIGLYTFMQAWDDFLFGITLIVSDDLRTLSAGISLRFLGEVAYDWGQVSAVSVIGLLPMAAGLLFFQRYMVQGLTAGAVKG